MANNYPPVGFFFRVEFQLGGVAAADAMFQDVTGFSADLETEPVKQGGENRYTQLLPTRAKYGDLTMKRGLLTSSKVAKWCRDAIENLDIQPITVVVTLLNEQGTPLQTFNFVNAWPKKWSMADLSASESKIVIETLELSYQYFRVS